MIEPIEGDRQCKRCLYCRRVSAFPSRRRVCSKCLATPVEVQTHFCPPCNVNYPLSAFWTKNGVPQNGKCKACVKRDRRLRHGWNEAPPAAEEQPWPDMPGDPRGPIQRELASVQARWVYPVEPAQLRWAA